MIVALDKFGTFTGIQNSKSAALPESFPNTPTFTFRNATYASNYISFVSVEQLDRNHTRLQNVTADQTALIKTYDTAGSIPFIDFANKYVLVGSQFSPAVLRAANAATGAPYDSSQIASQLNNANSTFAQSIDAAANRLISAICKIDGGSPTSVCSQPFAETLNYVRGSPSSGSWDLLSNSRQLNIPVLGPGESPPRPPTATAFVPGAYTVTVADEWGQAAVLHFVVRSSE